MRETETTQSEEQFENDEDDADEMTAGYTFWT